METLNTLACLALPVGIAIAIIFALLYVRQILLAPFRAIGRIYMDIVNKK